jgi:hypothetical protein
VFLAATQTIIGAGILSISPFNWPTSSAKRKNEKRFIWRGGLKVVLLANEMGKLYSPVSERMATDFGNKLVAGDGWDWQFNDLARDYDSSLFSVQLFFRGPGTLDLQSASGDGFHVAATPAQTADLPPGQYAWQLVLISNDGNPSATPPVLPTSRTEIQRGTIDVLQNIQKLAAGVDLRSFVKKTLDALETAFLDLAQHNMSEYEVPMPAGGNRKIRYMSRDELERQLNRYRWLYKQEQIKSGALSPQSNHVSVRFS